MKPRDADKKGNQKVNLYHWSSAIGSWGDYFKKMSSDLFGIRSPEAAISKYPRNPQKSASIKQRNKKKILVNT